jgi:hypothetical protein
MQLAAKTLLILAVAVLGITTAEVTSADNGSPTVGHIGICHHTGNSKAHEFVYIEPDASGVLDGHGKLSHQFGDDIIPAFSFTNAHGQTITFPGLNLSTVYGGVTGAVLLANRCKPPAASAATTAPVAQTTTQAATTTQTPPAAATPPPPAAVTPTTVTTTVQITTPTATVTKTVTVPFGETRTVTVQGKTATVHNGPKLVASTSGHSSRAIKHLTG